MADDEFITSIRSVVDDAMDSLDQPEAKWLIERVSADTMAAVVAALSRDGLTGASAAVAALEKRWRDAS
jgi:hypothetical protein